MGKAIAEEAVAHGFAVDFVSGPVSPENLPKNDAIFVHSVVSACEMLAKAESLLSNVDILIFAAAVADYMPAEVHEEKLPKYTTDFTLTLKPTPDIAKTICAQKKPEQVAIGFALQTHDGPAKARGKLERKGLNGIVLNDPSSLNAADGNFSFLSVTADDFELWGRIDKTECAKRIFDVI